MVLVVVGSFSSTSMINLLKDVFGKHERKIEVSYTYPEEPKSVSPAELHIIREVHEGYIGVGFLSESVYSEWMYPLDVAAVILGEGRYARLTRILKEEKGLCNYVECYNYTPSYPGVFFILMTSSPSLIKEAYSALISELSAFSTYKPPTEEEIERAKNRIIMDFSFRRQTYRGIASQIGSDYIYTGDENFSSHYIEKIKEVSKEEIVEAVKRYLDPSRRRVVFLSPLQPEEREEEIARIMKLSDFTLPSGLKVILCSNPTLPILHITLAYKAGLTADGTSSQGLAYTAIKQMLRGTKEKTYEDIIKEVEMWGGEISTFSGRNSSGITLNLPATYAEAGLKLLKEVILEVKFSEEELAKVKEEVLSDILSRKDTPYSLGEDLLFQILWKDHPFSLPPPGSTNTLNNITIRDIQRFHKEHFRLDNAVLTVVGAIEEGTLTPILEELFSKPMSLGDKREKPQTFPLSFAGTKTLLYKGEGVKEGVLMLGFLIPGIKDISHYGVEVLNFILSRQGGRLFRRIREELGLAYAVGSYLILGLDTGAYIIYAGCAPDTMDLIKEEIFSVIKGLKEDLKEETKEVNSELISAKSYISGERERALQNYPSLALHLTLDELYSFGYLHTIQGYKERINKITLQDIERIITDYIREDKYGEVRVLPAE
jgi:zinc protease